MRQLGRQSGEIPARRISAMGAICFLLLALHAALAVNSLRQHSATVDEGGHVLAGLLSWDEGRVDVYAVNPPFVKAMMALPVALACPSLSASVRRNVSPDWSQQHAQFMHANREQYLQLIWRARCVLVALSVLGGWLVYRWSSQLFGSLSGLVALALWAFCPNVLAWAGVCTVDLGATVFGLAAVYALRYYIYHPGSLNALWTGFILGLASLCKFSLLVLYPVFALVWFAAWWPSRRMGGFIGSAARWIDFAIVLVVSVLVINMGYGFQGSNRPLGSFSFRSKALRGLVEEPWIRDTWLESLPVPLPEAFLTGLDEQKAHADAGLPAYLNGRWQQGGWWYYYLYALGVKLPLGTLFLAGLAGALILCRVHYRAPLTEELLLWLPAGAILLLISSQTGINSHLRYVLPMFPFVFIGISRVGMLLAQAWERGLRRWALGVFLGAAAVVLALAWNVAAVARIHPHYLSYFNELAGGPDNGWQHLLESNIDWGQDLLFLKRWVDKHPEAQPLGLAYYGGMDPHLVGLDYQLPPSAAEPNFTGPQPGWYAISVNFVGGASSASCDEFGQRIYFAKDAYSYFGRLAPVAKAGYSIFIYHIKPEDAREKGDSHLFFPTLEGRKMTADKGKKDECPPFSVRRWIMRPTNCSYKGDRHVFLGKKTCLSPRQAFTLVELLVVIGIISILIG